MNHRLAEEGLGTRLKSPLSDITVLDPGEMKWKNLQGRSTKTSFLLPQITIFSSPFQDKILLPGPMLHCQDPKFH